MNKKTGFTLAELLIVVAILAVLIAISIPVFNEKLEKSRDTVTVANLRAAYTSAAEDIMENRVEVENGKYTVKKVIQVMGTKDGGIGEEDGYKYPFTLGAEFEKFGNKNNWQNQDGMVTVVFEWNVNATVQGSDIEYTDGCTARPE